MKNMRTFAVTLGVGSLLAWAMSDSDRRKSIQQKGSSVILKLKNLRISDDDNDMRYI
jgi:hypothetical protein